MNCVKTWEPTWRRQRYIRRNGTDPWAAAAVCTTKCVLLPRTIGRCKTCLFCWAFLCFRYYTGFMRRAALVIRPPELQRQRKFHSKFFSEYYLLLRIVSLLSYDFYDHNGRYSSATEASLKKNAALYTFDMAWYPSQISPVLLYSFLLLLQNHTSPSLSWRSTYSSKLRTRQHMNAAESQLVLDGFWWLIQQRTMILWKTTVCTDSRATYFLLAKNQSNSTQLWRTHSAYCGSHASRGTREYADVNVVWEKCCQCLFEKRLFCSSAVCNRLQPRNVEWPTTAFWNTMIIKAVFSRRSKMLAAFSRNTFTILSVLISPSRNDSSRPKPSLLSSFSCPSKILDYASRPRRSAAESKNLSQQYGRLSPAWYCRRGFTPDHTAKPSEKFHVCASVAWTLPAWNRLLAAIAQANDYFHEPKPAKLCRVSAFREWIHLIPFRLRRLRFSLFHFRTALFFGLHAAWRTLVLVPPEDL